MIVLDTDDEEGKLKERSLKPVLDGLDLGKSLGVNGGKLIVFSATY